MIIQALRNQAGKRDECVREKDIEVLDHDSPSPEQIADSINELEGGHQGQDRAKIANPIGWYAHEPARDQSLKHLNHLQI